MDGSEPEADYGPNPDSEEEQAELEEQPGYSNAGVSTPSDAGTMPQRSEGVSFTSFDRWHGSCAANLAVAAAARPNTAWQLHGKRPNGWNEVLSRNGLIQDTDQKMSIQGERL